MLSGVPKRENIFFIALVTYILRSFIFVLAGDISAVLLMIAKIFLVVDFLLVSVKLVSDFSQDLISKEKIRIMILGYAIAILMLVFLKSVSYIYVWTIICAAHNISFHKIAIVTSVTMLAAIVFVFLACAVGILDNTKSTGWGENYIREAYGIGFSHYFDAAHMTFNAVVVYLYARREKITWAELILLSALQIIVYANATTRNPFAVGMIAVGICALLKISSWLREYKPVYGIIAEWIHPVCAAFIIFLSAKCDLQDEKIIKFNDLLTGRLMLGQSAIKNYGITAFGQAIEWSLGDDGKAYNIVDSSYLCTLLNHGVIYLLMILLMFFILGRYSKKYKDVYFVMMTATIAVHATFDTGLLNFPCNIMFFVLSYMFCYGITDKEPTSLAQ